MNPLMLQMMNPMGMGFMPFSCCSLMYSRPYERDLSFFNFPIYRNTSMDWILDPSIAFRQVQENWQNGSMGFGGFGGIRGFGGYTFPGLSPMINPALNNRRSETEEEKSKREAKEAESKKPEAEKAASLKKVFDNIKKLAETNKNFVNLDSNIIKRAEDAMKKETAAEQLSAMKEVIAAIPDDIIRKSILADDEVKKQLKEAGYNFNYKNNQYSLPDDSIVDNFNEVHDSIKNKLSATTANTGLPLLCFNIKKGNTPILTAISTWNNTQNEKGILNFIAQNIPTEEGPKGQMQLCVVDLANALIAKADEYSSCEKIKKERDNVASLKDKILDAKQFNATNVKALSSAFEKLYARLRMQEAVKVRDYIKTNSDFKAINEAKPGFINDGMIVDETYECLKKEGITSVPKESELDKIASVTVITIGAEGVIDADKKYEGKPQELIDEYFVNEKNILTKVDETNNIYATTDFDGKGSGVKYYTVRGGKIVEATKTADGKYKDAAGVTAKEIEKYDESIKTIKSMRESKSIERCNDFTSAKLPYPVFKAATKNEYYALIGNTFGKIKGCTGLKDDKENLVKGSKTNHVVHATGTGKILNNLTEADLEDFDVSSVKSKEQEEIDKKEAEAKKKAEDNQKRIANITKDKYAFKTMNNHLNELGLEATGVIGYYKTKEEPTLFFMYDEKSQKLQYLQNVTEVRPWGTMKVGNSVKYCKEVQSPEKSAEDLHELLNTTAYKYDNYLTYKSKDEVDKDLFTIKRKMSSFRLYNKVCDIIGFIRSYNDCAYHWWKQNDSSLPFAIAENKIIPEADKKEFIKLIASQIYKVAETKGVTFDNPDDKVTLEHIANGRLVEYNYEAAALNLSTTAAELNRIIEIILEKLN